MVIYSDESDYETSWRRVDAMFDCIPIGVVQDCGTRLSAFSPISSFNRNYRTPTECEGERKETECSETAGEMEELICEIVKEMEAEVFSPVIVVQEEEEDYIVEPTKIVYPKVYTNTPLHQHTFTHSQIYHFPASTPSPDNPKSLKS